MLGRLDVPTLTARIKDKRNQDALRALGLVPLAKGRAREADLLDRYGVMQEFARGSRQFGAQRQASEKSAVAVALENLARTAGYPDPVRLEWAMEARAVADLAAGPVVATAGDVTVALSINEWGTPEIAVTKKDKALKALPPAAKKVPEVAALVARKTEIERQASRMRLSLEGAMCRGDEFTGAELRQLLAAPRPRADAALAGPGRPGRPRRLSHQRRQRAGRLRRGDSGRRGQRPGCASPTRTTCWRRAAGTTGSASASPTSASSPSSRSSANCTC